MQIFYLVGTVPVNILYIINEVFKFSNSRPILDLFYSITNFFLILMPGLNIIIYHHFNKLYHKVLNGYFNAIIGHFKI